MKKVFLLLFFIILCSFVYTQQWDYFHDISEYSLFSEKQYKIKQKTKLYDSDGDVIEELKANQIIESSRLAWVQDESNHPFDMFEYLIGYEYGWISTDDLVLVNSEQLPDAIITYNKQRFEKKWIPIWYNNILASNKKLDDYSCFYDGYKDTEEFVLYKLHTVKINNNFLIFSSLSQDHIFSIKRIESNNTLFYIHCELEISEQSEFNDFLKNESFNNFPDFTNNRDTTFIVEQNGNRLRIYNGDNKKLIIELMQTNNDWTDSMVRYIKSGYKDKASNLSIIEENLDHPWSDPVTGFYEGSSEDTLNWPAISSVNLTQTQLMSVSENLKLRSTEATTSEVLTVMAAGTNVKILELGHEETIDGITSNWVKVELLAGATDRDGNPIEKGTIGWCYGGYLEEVETDESETPDNGITAKKSKNQKADILSLVISIAAGVVLLIVVIMVVVVVRKKKKQ